MVRALGAAIVDGGAPTGQCKTVNANGGVNDGGSVTGWGVFEADSIDAAVEVGEAMDVPGM